MPDKQLDTDPHIDGIHWGEATISIRWNKDVYGNEERPGACVLHYGSIAAMCPWMDITLSVIVKGCTVQIPCGDPQALMALIQERIEAWWAKHD